MPAEFAVFEFAAILVALLHLCASALQTALFSLCYYMTKLD